jgi:hypothetical protein
MFVVLPSAVVGAKPRHRHHAHHRPHPCPTHAAGGDRTAGAAQLCKKPTAPLSLTSYSIRAIFYPAPQGTHPCPPDACRTIYDIGIDNAVRPVTVTWTLSLQLVDPVGAPDPNVSGSMAAVDYGCNNNGDGKPDSPHKTTYTGQPGPGVSVFIWYHPNGADSNPPGTYNCNHMEQGPHGHQGLITVEVKDSRGQTCRVSYKGTYSGTSKDQGDVPKCSG